MILGLFAIRRRVRLGGETNRKGRRERIRVQTCTLRQYLSHASFGGIPAVERGNAKNLANLRPVRLVVGEGTAEAAEGAER
jgi:hypothetical protein